MSEGRTWQRSDSLSLSQAPAHWHSCLCGQPRLHTPSLNTGPGSLFRRRPSPQASQGAGPLDTPPGQPPVTRLCGCCPTGSAETLEARRGRPVWGAPTVGAQAPATDAPTAARPGHPTHSTCWRRPAGPAGCGSGRRAGPRVSARGPGPPGRGPARADGAGRGGEPRPGGGGAMSPKTEEVAELGSRPRSRVSKVHAPRH